MSHAWCRFCEQNVRAGSDGKPVRFHKARCGLTCDPHDVRSFYSGHTPVPGTLRRHFSMTDCQKKGEHELCPKRRRSQK